jgi:hypothetical protein
MSTVVSIAGACVVCGETDSRALATTRLARGDVVVVCGTHELIHQRSAARARTIVELRALVGERRDRPERRAMGGDELGEALSAAFTKRELRTSDRRGR